MTTYNGIFKGSGRVSCLQIECMKRNIHVVRFMFFGGGGRLYFGDFWRGGGVTMYTLRT